MEAAEVSPYSQLFEATFASGVKAIELAIAFFLPTVVPCQT